MGKILLIKKTLCHNYGTAHLNKYLIKPRLVTQKGRPFVLKPKDYLEASGWKNNEKLLYVNVFAVPTIYGLSTTYQLFNIFQLYLRFKPK